jgi:dipeptidyl aminopeptidase/acylaminoacyl peptidase
MRAAIVMGAVLALSACADVAGPTRTETPLDLPGTLLVVRNWVTERTEYWDPQQPALPEGTPGLFRAEGIGRFTPMFENTGVNEFADVALSADGERLAWQIFGNPRTQQGSRIVTLDLATGERRTITPVSIPAARSDPLDYSPSWTPDGERLAVIRVTRDERGVITGQSIVITDASGTVLATPFTSMDFLQRLNWHPDGRSLTTQRVQTMNPSPGVFVVRRDLLRIGLDGTVAVLIGGNAPLQAFWAPDGRRFAAEDETGFALRAADGSLLQRVATGFRAYEFAWSPDGRFLAYCGRAPEDNATSVWIWDGERRSHRRLSPAKVSDCRPMWGR